MAFFRSFWVIAVTVFELNFGAGDRRWPMGVMALALVGLCLVDGVTQLDVAMTGIGYFVVMLLGVEIRRARGAPTTATAQVRRAASAGVLQWGAPHG